MDDGDILAAVAAEEPAMVDLLAELVAAPTLLGHEAAGQAVMRRAFADLGLEPVDVPLRPRGLEGHPARRAVRAGTSTARRTSSRTGSRDRRGGRSLILNGHIDVVSPEPASLWTSDPFVARRDGEWVYGRGAGDMKSGLAAIVGAVRGAAAARPRPGRRGHSCSPSSRRSAPATARWPACSPATRRRGDPHRADAGRDLAGAGRRPVVPGPRPGAPAHAGDADEGANAIEASYAVIAALRALEAELNVGRRRSYAAYPTPSTSTSG